MRRLPSRPGASGILLAALSIGLVLLAVQLWLLTVALDLLGGHGRDVWQLALASAAIFAGGVTALRLAR